MIEFKGVRKAFGEHVVLEDVTLTVRDRETLVVIGYSGTGKSVLLKHVVGLLQPDAGQVIVDGQSVPDLDRDGLSGVRAQVGYVFQSAALFDSLTVADNVALGLRRRDLSEDEIGQRVSEALALVDLTGTDEKLPAELSGGMRKRVGIARAIALRPRYILYDEPTTGLDPVTSAVIDQLMVRTREHLGVTGIVVTHDMRSAYTVGDRIAMLYEGRIRQVGSVAEIQATQDPLVRQFIEGIPSVKRENEFAVGLAVIAALTLVVGGALWLSGAHLGKTEAVYTARFKTVGGLGVGNPVVLRGVRIGRVESIRLASGNWVEADLKVYTGVSLPPRPAAIAASASLFGEWAVTLTSQDQLPDDANVRAAITEAAAAGGGKWPGATLPDIGQLTAQASRIATDIGTVANRIQTAFDTNAVNDLRRSIHDFGLIADRLVKVTDEQATVVGNVGQNLQNGSKALSDAATRLQTTIGRVDSATSAGQVSSILNNTAAASQDIRTTSADLRDLAEAAHKNQESLVRVLVNADTVMSRIANKTGTLGLLVADSSLYKETTFTMIQLRQLLADIQANPRKYFTFSVF